jgi:hypothetical protein
VTGLGKILPLGRIFLPLGAFFLKNTAQKLPLKGLKNKNFMYFRYYLEKEISVECQHDTYFKYKHAAFISLNTNKYQYNFSSNYDYEKSSFLCRKDLSAILCDFLRQFGAFFTKPSGHTGWYKNVSNRSSFNLPAVFDVSKVITLI